MTCLHPSMSVFTSLKDEKCPGWAPGFISIVENFYQLRQWMKVWILSFLNTGSPWSTRWCCKLGCENLSPQTWLWDCLPHWLLGVVFWVRPLDLLSHYYGPIVLWTLVVYQPPSGKNPICCSPGTSGHQKGKGYVLLLNSPIVLWTLVVYQPPACKNPINMSDEFSVPQVPVVTERGRVMCFFWL